MLQHIWPLPQKYIVSFKVISLFYHKISTAKACVLSSMPSNMQLNSSGARYYKFKSWSYSPSCYFHIIPIKPEFPLMLIPASLGYLRYNEILIYPVQYTGGKYILSNMLGGSQNYSSLEFMYYSRRIPSIISKEKRCTEQSSGENRHKCPGVPFWWSCTRHT